MDTNRIVVYSNGIADFQRLYSVHANQACRISIPVRQDHLADVLASFNVYGDVRLASPPTFRPSNELAGNITIDPTRVLEDLATKLSGARMRLDRAAGAIEGVLMGIHHEEEASGGEPVDAKSIVLLTDGGLRRCSIREVTQFSFLDDEVQSEIEKALQRNYQRIKPNSTFVELELSAEESTDAVVQYTIPAAAWKISYRLHLSDENRGQLHGFAVVDNNTEEDWIDFKVSVVTGEPITFTTDLAESKSPSRSHVSLVSETALGAVEVESLSRAMSACAADAAFGPESGERLHAPQFAFKKIARVDSAEVREVGDFSIFESESQVSIPAKRSAVIPVFNTSIADMSSTLHYKFEDHPTRPYRSIDFVNRTEFSLGRGVCTVFEVETYVGSCVLPPLKPGESRLLPHALETGVSVEKDTRRLRQKIVALRLADGFCYTSARQWQETHYHIINNRDVDFRLFLDHSFLLHEPELNASVTGVQETSIQPESLLKAGVRYQVSLFAKSELVLRIEEQTVSQTSVHLVAASKKRDQTNVDWLHTNLVQTNGPLANDPQVLLCLKLKQQMNDKSRAITDRIEEMQRLAERQDRLRQNIQTGGQDELTSRWRSELDQSERAIRSIEEEQLPGLRAEEERLLAELRSTLKSLAAEWQEES